MIGRTVTMVTRWWRGELLTVTSRTLLRVLIEKADMNDRYFWKRSRANA